MDRTRQGTANTNRIKVVCQDCNNIWISALETEVKPILTPLIRGEAIILNAAARQTLSEWDCDERLVAEHNAHSGSPADPIFDQNARNEFRLNRTIPQGFRIWIGTHNGTKWRSAIFRHCVGLMPLGTTLPPHPRPKNVQTVTFGLGSLLIQIFATTTPANNRIEFDGLTPAFRLLWPLIETSIAWRPFYILTDNDGDRVASMLQNLMDSPTIGWMDI
jgi:hypothetical protein